MRPLDSQEEQRKGTGMAVRDVQQEAARRLRRKMRVHSRPSAARATSASAAAKGDESTSRLT